MLFKTRALTICRHSDVMSLIWGATLPNFKDLTHNKHVKINMIRDQFTITPNTNIQVYFQLKSNSVHIQAVKSQIMARKIRSNIHSFDTSTR